MHFEITGRFLLTILIRHTVFSGIHCQKMTKSTTSWDWVVSTITEQTLSEYVGMGVLPTKDVIRWRVPGAEVLPQPREG